MSSSDFECGICGKVLANKDSFTRHLTLHDNADYNCHVCNAAYHNKYSLKYHLKQHSEEKKCTFCGKEITTKYWLKRHEEVSHGEKPRYRCQTCLKPCFSSEVLAARALKHGGHEKPYNCNKCHRSYMYKGSLTKHKCVPQAESTQTPNRYECAVCKKTFKCARFLKQPDNVHKEKRLHCHICGKTFRWKNCFELHLKRCGGEK